MKNIISISILLLANFIAKSQAVIEYLDINNVKAGILNKGDMFWNPNTGYASYEFPKGSGKHSNFATSIWIAGFDTNNTLHVSAQTYRLSGSDYWSGPLENNTDSVTTSTNNLWDKIWKVNASTIDSFKQISIHTLSNTAMSILDWPAKGNIYATGKNGVNLNIGNLRYFAPFVDLNNDSLYNPLDGDYPKVTGEQALWWIFNDHGNSHNVSYKIPFHFEIHAMAHACNVAPLQDVTFYSYKLVNRSSMPYYNTRLGIWADVDLGYYKDDYIGFDSSTRMGICYNGNVIDSQYGANLTQTGIKLLYTQGDSLGYQSPIGCFTTHQYGAFGPPLLDTFFHNFLNAKWTDGSPQVKNCYGYGTGIPTNTLYADEPNIIGGNSELQCANTPDDRRFILATNDLTILPNEYQVISIAVLNTPTGSSNSDFSVIKNLAMQVEQNAISCATPMSMPLIARQNKVKIFPNPSNEKINIETDFTIDQIDILSADGKLVLQRKYNNNSIFINIDTKALSNGNYFLLIKNKDFNVTKKLNIIH